MINNDFLFHASKFYIGYSRRGNTNEVYVQRSKKKIQKVQNDYTEYFKKSIVVVVIILVFVVFVEC